MTAATGAEVKQAQGSVQAVDLQALLHVELYRVLGKTGFC